MDIKKIIRKTLTIAVLLSSVIFISCSDKLYTGSSKQEDEVWIKHKTNEEITQSQSIPSPYTEKYKAKLMEK